jgi:predicted Zn-dependent protease
MSGSQRRFQKIFVMTVSGLMFVSTSATSLIGLVRSQSPKPESMPTQVSVKDTLKEEAKNYELVLKKEPNNRNALNGLVQTHLKLNDFDSAKQPLQKLITLEPQNKLHRELMANIQKKTSKPSTSNTTQK